MRTARTVCTLALLLAAGQVFAATETKAAASKSAAKSAAKSTVKYYKTIDNKLKPVTLTDDQSAKLDALKKDYEQKFKDAYAKANVLTPDQQKAADDARKAAKEAGKTRKETNKAVADAVKETEDQKAKAKEANKDLRALQKEFLGKVQDLLTTDQKKQIEDATPAKSSKPKKAAKPAAPAATSSN